MTATESSATPSEPVSAFLVWQAVDERSVDVLPDYADHWSEEGRVLVSVAGTVEASRSWQVGDRLTLPVPQLGQTYQPAISEIDDGPGGARAAVARMTDADGHPLRSVVTAGPGHVFAWLETPEGSYELFGDAEHGWLLPTMSMTANMDFTRRDYLLPGEDVSVLFPETENPTDRQ